MQGLTRRGFAVLAGGAAIGAAATKSLAAMPDRVAMPAGGAAVPVAGNPLRLVNPELRPAFSRLRAMMAGHPLDSATLATRRAMKFPAPAYDPATVQQRMIPVPGGGSVRIYIINGAASAQSVRPAILHIHGGGYVLLDATTGLGTLIDTARELDCVIVTVDYSLAPEVRFPGSLEQNYAGLKWLHTHAESLGVDPRRIAVMGESAGGGHAAMLAIAARDRGEVPVIFQALTYPMLDDRTGSTRQPPLPDDAYTWTPHDNRFGWTALLGVPAGSPAVPPGSVPARVADLHGLPPTFIGVGSIDLFAGESVEYARRLMDAAIPVELVVVPGAFHGFDMFPTVIGKQYHASYIHALRTGLDPASWPRN